MRGPKLWRAALMRARILLAVVGLTMVMAFATYTIRLDRLVLWQVVRTCVADFKLTGAPFPCLEVDLSAGEERGSVVLRPPLSHEIILAPTRKIIGIEDPFLESTDAPNYFDAAWRARSFLEGTGGRALERDAVALIVNSAVVRAQDQLHIHVVCLLPSALRSLAAAAPKLPIRKWAWIGAVVPHTMFWGMRVRGTDLSDVEPFRIAAEGLADKVRVLGDLMIMVASVRVGGDDDFLILFSYAGAPGAWWPWGDNDMLDPNCRAGRRLSG
jgi:CDP-diacylglycerol pyrophosphatase